MPDSAEDATELIETLEGTMPRLEFLAKVDALVAEFPDSDELRAKQTVAYLKSGDAVRARQMADAHLALGRPVQAVAASGVVALQAGEIDKAKALIDEARRIDVASAEVSAVASTFARLTGDPYASVTLAAAALAAKPNTPRYEVGFLRALIHAGRVQEAAQRWEAAESWFKDTYGYWLIGGLMATQRHDFFAAEAAYRSALALKPYSSEAWSALGGILLLTQRAQEAETAARNALDEAPGNSRALRLRAMLAQKRGQLEDASEFERQAIAQSPLTAGLAHINEAMTFVQTGKRDEAFRALALAYEQTPAGLHSYVRRLHVQLLAMFGRWEELALVLPQIGPAEANWPGVVFARAKLLDHQNRPSDAINLLEQPADIPSVANQALLLRLYKKCGQTEKIGPLADALAGVNAGSQTDFAPAHVALLSVGRREQADALLARGLRLFPNSDLLKLHEAKRLFRTGSPDLARSIVAQLPPMMRESFYPKHSPWSRKYWKRIGRVFQNAWVVRRKK